MKKLLAILTFIGAQSVVIAQENAGTNRVVLTPELVNELAEEARTNTLSPASRAQEASSDEVSIARMLGMPYFNRSAARQPWCGPLASRLQRSRQLALECRSCIA